jgi:hypothetical protein
VKETGQIAHDAFRAKMGWEPLAWEDLSWREQEAWRAAAHEVMQKGWTQAQRPKLRKGTLAEIVRDTPQTRK